MPGNEGRAKGPTANGHLEPEAPDENATSDNGAQPEESAAEKAASD
jgi:hypothetical protein